MIGNVLSDVKQTVEKNGADELFKVKQCLRKWGRVQQICGEHQVRIVQYNRLLERLQQHKCKMGAERKGENRKILQKQYPKHGKKYRGAEQVCQ